MENIPPAVLEGPAAPPPPGAVPNLVNPESKGQLLIVLPAVLIAIMWLSVLGRLYVKLFVLKIKTADDLTCFIAAILTTFYFGITVASVQYAHIGTHLWDVRLMDFIGVGSIKVEYLSLIMAPVTLMFIKASFFLMFLQIFKPVQALCIASYIGLAITILGYMGWFIAFMILGTPHRGETWQSHFVGPQMAAVTDLSIPLPAFGLALDIIILVLPIYGVAGLQLSTKRKIGVIGIFLTALVAILCSILSIVYRVSVQSEGETDLTYDLLPAFLTSDLEMNLGVIILCMPAYALLIQTSRTFYRSLRSRLSSRASKSHSQLPLDGHSGKHQYSLSSQGNGSSKGNVGFSSHIEGGSTIDVMSMDREDAKNNIHMTTVVRQDHSAV